MICYRHAKYSTPLRTIPATGPGRYHRGGEAEATQYLCQHPLGPMAELMRTGDLRALEQIRAVRARTWVLEVEADSLPAVNFANAAEFGIRPDDLVDDDYDACQDLADRLRADGVTGVTVPSAALPGTSNIVIFGPRVAAPYLFRPMGVVDVPASVTAEDGRPLAGLLAVVRFRGEAHAELMARRAGTTFTFSEPDWSFLEPT